jgi:predicted DNA-binding transcriptional regulator YafY
VRSSWGPSDIHTGGRAPNLGALRGAIRDGRKVHFRYLDEGGKESRRTVRPLALAFWGKIWSMASWCELRQDFRNFRLDRISEIDLKERFEAEPGKTLDDFIRRVTQHPTQRARDPSAKPVQSS